MQKPRGKDYYLFQGFIRCGDCRRGMNVNTRKAGRKRVAVGYYCSTYRSDTTKCSKHYVNEKELAKVVLKTIKHQIKLMANCSDKIFKINKIANPDVNFEILNNKRAEIEDEIENKMKLKLGLYSDWKDKIISQEQFQSYSENYDNEIKELRVRLDLINNDIDDLKELIVINKYDWLYRKFDLKEMKELNRDILFDMVDLIYIYEDSKIEIHFKYEDEYQNVIEFLKRQAKNNKKQKLA